MMVKNPIQILGTGLITPLGVGSWANFSALLTGKTILSRKSELPEDISSFDLVKTLGSVSCVQHDPADPIVGLLMKVIEEACFESESQGHEQSTEQVPLFLGLSKGAMHALNDAADLLKGEDSFRRRGGLKKPRAKDALDTFRLGPHGYVTQALKERLGHIHRKHRATPGPIEHWVAACSSGLVALHKAINWLNRQDDGTMAVVAAAESALIPNFVQSYERLGVLAKPTYKNYAGFPMAQPPKGEEKGFMLSEQGAAIVLVKGERHHARYGSIQKTFAATEPFDLIRPSEEPGNLIAFLNQLLSETTTAILHPHATGTQQHDETEYAVMCKLNESIDIPGIYAAKGALGHGLGASGLVSLVLAAMMKRAGQIPPMPWISEPLTSRNHDLLSLRRHLVRMKIDQRQSHLIWSAGFGGHLAGALLV